MVRETITRAKVKLLLQHPFFASLLMPMELIEDANIPTACTDGKSIKINPTFFDDLTEDERIGLLAHEVLHPAFLHHTRMGSRNPLIWNIACDYAINPILVDSGLRIPEGGCLDAKYSGMSAEDIYSKIYQDVKQKCQGSGGGNDDGDGQSGQGDGTWKPGDGFDLSGHGKSFGDVEPFPSEDQAEVQKEEQGQIGKMVTAHQIAKMQGKGSALIDRMIQEYLDPVVDWQVLLQQWISEKILDDYTWKKPSSRYMNTGFYMPTLESETFAEIACYVDTSGSMSQDEMNQIAGELNAIGELMKSTFHVVYCDSSVTNYQCFEGEDAVELKVYGGGGTDFRPPFKYMEKHNLDQDIKVAFYFTDGYCSSFPEEPDYPVLWFITPNSGGYSHSNSGFKPPFGEVIYMS